MRKYDTLVLGVQCLMGGGLKTSFYCTPRIRARQHGTFAHAELRKTPKLPKSRR